MPCQILVAYQCAVQVGEIVGVFEGDHVFGRMETLTAWGDRDTWHRHFTLIKVSNRSKAELKHLTDKPMIIGGLDPIPGKVARYHFASPAQTDPEYTPLNDTGEIACNWAVAMAFLRERN